MKLKLFASVITLLFYYDFAMAQEWSKEDSIWLQNILEGKEVLKLNEDVIKAIKDGQALPPFQMKKEVNPNLEIIKDFENIEAPDLDSKIDLKSMPRGVFYLHIDKMVKMNPSTNTEFSFSLTDKELNQIKSSLPTTLSDMIIPVNTDPLHSYGVGNIFSIIPFLVNKISNRQPEPDENKPKRFNESERQQLNESINSLRQSIEASTEQE